MLRNGLAMRMFRPLAPGGMPACCAHDENSIEGGSGGDVEDDFAGDDGGDGGAFELPAGEGCVAAFGGELVRVDLNFLFGVEDDHVAVGAFFEGAFVRGGEW